MKGGVGRYTSNLVSALRNDAEVEIICDKSNSPHSGDLHNVTSPGDYGNSDEILRITKEVRPDIVHVQYEASLYEAVRSSDIWGSRSTLEKFYSKCPVPTVTTQHTVFAREEYLAFVKESSTGNGKSNIPGMLKKYARSQALRKFYDQLIGIGALTTEVINLSNTSRNIIGRGRVIYIGSEPFPGPMLSKMQLRQELRLPQEKMILLAFGHPGSSSGFDILDRLELPANWVLAIKQTSRGRGTEQPAEVQNAIHLDSDYFDEQSFSKLLFACDAVIIPRKLVAASTSGVLFDALAHALPFVGSDSILFREFADMGLGLVSKIEPESFSNAISRLASDYNTFKQNVQQFVPKMQWSAVASSHLETYKHLLLKS